MDSKVVETHISWNFFSDERVFKLLKPVSLGFVDFSDTATRLAAAERELQLNRRLAPDVYLGTADVVEEGVVTDRMIVSRRLPAERRLSALAGTPDFGDHLRSIARTIAAFHSTAAVHSDAPGATRDALATDWADNFDTIDPFVGSVIDPAHHELAQRRVQAFLDGRAPLFEQRLEGGYVRDGHGDLIADDIFCLDDGPRILDCLAFRDDWRIGDVLADIAFLVMDVQRLAGRGAAEALMAWYREFSDEHHPVSLEHHYIAYRAHVRCKVACLRFGQGDDASAALARTYHGLALEHLEAGRIRLCLVGGGPGVGKSTLAARVGERLGYPVLRTDEIRKALAGLSSTDHLFAAPGEGIYTAEATEATHAEMLREAGLLVDRGSGVVLDASWSNARHRELARDVAARTGAEMVEIECVLPPEIAKARILRRMGESTNVSDATAEIVDQKAATRDPWPSAHAISTDASEEDVFHEAMAFVSGVGS